MTYRDGLTRFSARSVRRGDSGHREACATLSVNLVKPPFRSPMQSLGVRRKTLAMPRIACGFPPARRTAWAIPVGHYHRSLVLLGKFFTCPGWQGMHALLQPSLKKDTR